MEHVTPDFPCPTSFSCFLPVLLRSGMMLVVPPKLLKSRGLALMVQQCMFLAKSILSKCLANEWFLTQNTESTQQRLKESQLLRVYSKTRKRGRRESQKKEMDQNGPFTGRLTQGKENWINTSNSRQRN